MSIMAKTPSGYKKIGSAYLGERPVDKVFNANGDVIYALQRELTGVPPLLFKGKEQSELLNYRICGDTETKQRDYSGSSPLTVPVHDGELYNYRIYGNTVNGESVGDRTGNLFDGVVEQGSFNGNTGAETDSQIRIRTSFSISLPSGTYTINATGIDNIVVYVYIDPDTFDKTSSIRNWQTAPLTFTLSDNRFVRFAFSKTNNSTISIIDISQIMLNLGSTALPYEPYGYKVPITVTNSGTTSNETIYLPEPIKMVGSEAEYVDFYSQKQYFADGTNTAVTIPALPISTGTNTVTVNTTVQPSSVEVSTDENVSVGDLVTSGQHAGEYKVAVTVSNGTDTLTTPIYLPESIKMVGSEAEYIDYGEQKLHRVRKNLFDKTAAKNATAISRIDGGEYVNGAVVSSDYISVKPNAIYTNNSSFLSTGYAGIAFYDVNKQYLSGIQAGNSTANIPYTYTTPNNAAYMRVSIYTHSGGEGSISVDDFSVNEGSTALPYEPYIKNTDLDVTLPALPTIKGTNEMSVDTEVQPSRMDIKGRIKSLT